MEPTTSHQGTEKDDEVQAIQAAAAPVQAAFDPASPWTQRDPQTGDVPAPPPVWTRYIDSRLKQFCTR